MLSLDIFSLLFFVNIRLIYSRYFLNLKENAGAKYTLFKKNTKTINALNLPY